MKFTIFFTTSALLLLLVKMVFPQCDSTFLGEDQVLCPGETITLDAGNSSLSYQWSTGAISQTISVSEPGQYWCTVQVVDSTNIVVNGDFSQGNTGFQSNYEQNPVSVYLEGTYAITTNPNLVHPDFASCGDHTTGSGNMMVVNGAPVPNQNVWFESLPVSPNTDYHYSGWFTSVHWDNPALLNLSINGASIATVALTSATCFWQNFYAIWNSGENTTIDLQIVNQNTTMNGNDFAIDDISLYQVCLMTDTINITQSTAPVVDLGADTTLCEGSPFILDPGAAYAEYLWQDGSTDPTYEVTESGLYWVLVTNDDGCSGGDSIQVDVVPLPEIELGDDTTLCEGQQLLLNPGGGYNAYLWQDNSTGPVYTVTTAGTYWVMVFGENNCLSSDTIHVDYAPWPNIDLGDDTTLCEGEQLVLSAGSGYQSYTWQDNSPGPFYTVTQPGLYWCMVSNACSDDADSIMINYSPKPVPDLGNDTVICSGGSLTLQPPGNFDSYLWQDGSTLPFLIVGEAGLYSVEVSNIFGCTGEDEIYVDVSDPFVDLGENAEYCEGDTISLDAGPGFENYLWQDGSSGQNLTVTSTGDYSVSVTDDNNCQATGTVSIDFVPMPVADLGADQNLCAGDSIVLQAPPGDYTYYWNGQPGSDTYTVSAEGNYSLAVVNSCDSVSDVIYVSVTAIPQVDLGADQLAFPGETVTLDAGTGYDSYLWQNGDDGQTLGIDVNATPPPGDIYHVDVTLGACKSSDSVKVEFFDVSAPIVITPNGDGQNDNFKPDPEKWVGIDKNHIEVFNRWGEKVWASDDFQSGWDGKRNGRVVADGTYFWVLEVFYGSQELKKVIKGSLTVLGGGG